MCNEHSVPPFMLRSAMEDEFFIFNREISMIIMWLNGKPVLHIVNVETTFKMIYSQA